MMIYHPLKSLDLKKDFYNPKNLLGFQDDAELKGLDPCVHALQINDQDRAGIYFFGLYV